ncbi:MAG TPA: CapA family protein [Candidatus Avipropionibacterium avicola]|uniref:CapA family protein n=1 Tax=Candidatus Avipropionibacterium avicola TaxID=2840701 RepID=A0A9D1KNF2_9ACTN|nr:CapA family protein [Candidatus Avipropionibacterium avicola]
MTPEPYRIEPYRILVLGDFHFGESYRQAGATVLARHGYRHSTEHLRPFLAAADVRIVNLETPIVDPEQHPSPLHGRKTYLHWADPEATPAALVELGVDAVSLANNHTLDHGTAGLLETLDRLAAVDIDVFGAGRTLAEAVRGHQVMIPASHGGGTLRFTGSFQYSRRHDHEYGFYAGETTPGCAALSRRAVPPARSAEDPDDLLTIAFPHWGANYRWRTPGQQVLGQTLIGSGHDLVLGHGSHCVQEIDRIEQHWVVNGLGNGNFQSGGRFARYVREESILPYGFWAVLEIGAPEHGQRRVVLRLHPVHSDNHVTDFQPRPVSRDERDRILHQLLRRSVGAGAITPDTDDLGHHLVVPLGSWPVGGRLRPDPDPAPPTRPVRPVEPSPAATSSDGARRYNDPATRSVLAQYRSGRNLGAILNAEAAEAAGARVEWLAPNTAIAHFPDRRILVNGYKCDESDLGSRIVQDKLLLKQFLVDQGVSTPAGTLADTAEQAIAFAARLGRAVVVKPRAGNKGRGITVNITTAEQIRAAHARAARVGKGILVEEYVPVHQEYRVLATQVDCVSVVRRVLPNVTGNGTDTIARLIELKNAERALNPALFKREIPADAVTSAYLARQGRDLDTVLAPGERITVRDVGGLSSGGEPLECSTEVEPTVSETAVAAVAAIPGLSWGGCDIVVAEDGRAYVIEINSDADIGGATYPLVGEPKDVAGHMIALRMASSSAEVPTPTSAAPTSAVASAATPSPAAPAPAPRRVLDRLLRRRRPMPATPPSPPELASGPLAEAFVAWLERQGHTVTPVGSSIRRLEGPSLGTRWMTVEAMTASDLSAVRRVMRRHGLVRSFLVAADLPRVAGRRVVNPQQWSRFVHDHPGAVTVVPYRGEWTGPQAMVLDAPDGDDASVLVGSGLVGSGRVGSGPWFVQRHRSGTRLRVLATATEALAILGPGGLGSVSTVVDNRSAVAELAVRAVRAVPQLRWAAVDVVVGPTPGRVLVEGMGVAPVTPAGWSVLDGSLDAVFEMLRAGLVSDAA